MAKTVLLECDRCGESGGDVSNLSANRSDGMHIDFDLCAKCWDQFANDYGVRMTVRAPRRPFGVVNEEDIK